MALKLMGKKRGMTQIFDEAGNVVTCTVIHAEPNIITQIKSKEADGYNALQLGFEKIVVNDPRTMDQRVTKPLLGHFRKANIEPRRFLSETRVENLDGYNVGQELNVTLFTEVSHVDVSGVSKGKGFQGVIKRYGFSGGPASHGSGFHRHGGSTGMRTSPGRTLPGIKKAGRMGADHVTVQNLKVIRVDAERHLLLVEGAVPGPVGGLVLFAPARKKRMKKQ